MEKEITAETSTRMEHTDNTQNETHPSIKGEEDVNTEMQSTKITIADFAKVEVKVGTVVLCERVPETDKLLRLLIDIGEEEPRQIISGIASYVSEPDQLVGKQLSFVTNLAPRKLKGLESNGMLFAVGEGDTFAFLVPDRAIPSGTSAH